MTSQLVKLCRCFVYLTLVKAWNKNSCEGSVSFFLKFYLTHSFQIFVVGYFSHFLCNNVTRQDLQCHLVLCFYA